MRLTLCTLILSFTFVSQAFAQQVEVSSTARSTYLGTDGAIFYDGPVLQSDLSLSWENGFYAVLWGSTSNTTALDFDKEINAIFGFGGSLGKVNYSVDIAYFISQGIDVANANAELGFGPLYARIEGYEPVQSGGPGRGVISSLGLRHEASPFGTDKVRLILGSALKHDSGAFGYRKAWLYQGDLLLGFSITESFVIQGGLKGSNPISRPDDGRKREVAWELGISRSFGG